MPHTGATAKIWSQELYRVRAARESLRLQQDRKELIDLAVVRDGVKKCLAVMFKELERYLAHEQPGLCEGMTAIQILAANEKFLGDYRRRCLAGFDGIADGTGGPGADVPVELSVAPKRAGGAVGGTKRVAAGKRKKRPVRGGDHAVDP